MINEEALEQILKKWYEEGSGWEVQFPSPPGNSRDWEFLILNSLAYHTTGKQLTEADFLLKSLHFWQIDQKSNILRYESNLKLMTEAKCYFHPLSISPNTDNGLIM